MEGFIDFQTIKSLTLELGFQDCGAIKPNIIDISFFSEWLNKGYNAEMQYLGNNLDKRENPSLLLENGKSIISFILSYNTQEFADLQLNNSKDSNNNLKFAAYSYFDDYHKLIKQALYGIIACIQERYPDFKAVAFVDSSPFSEKMIAREAGLGFIGKNSFLISKKHGLHTLIGVILINKEVLYGEIEREGCGACRRCIDACPVNAILSPKVIDSRRCISYQTIESRRMRHEEEFPASKGEWMFGCDVCLNACPWSSRGEISSWECFQPLLHGGPGKFITETSDKI